MFGIFKSDPKKQLNKRYEALLQQAMTAQRNGDIKGYAELSEQAEAVGRELEALENQQGK